jgi:hypothetical protein
MTLQMVRRRSLVLFALTCLVAISASAATKTWTGAVNNLWSAGGNWNDGTPPADGDSLIFPEATGSSNNDLTGLDLASVTFSLSGALFGRTISGNAVTLSAGMNVFCCTHPTVWDPPTTLAASQTFTIGHSSNLSETTLELNQSLNLNGHTLTVDTVVESRAFFRQTISGAGALIVTGDGGINLIGTSPFTGAITVTDAGLNVVGSIALATVVVNSGGQLTGNGMIGGTTLADSSLLIGNDPSAGIGGDAGETGILSTGVFSMTGGSAHFGISGVTAGTHYDQLAVTGTVTLNNPALMVRYGFRPSDPFFLAPGQTFTIISNDGGDAVVGTFAALAENARFSSFGDSYQITYAGGDGNDVVLTALATTTTTLNASPNPVVPGQSSTLTATVTSPAGTPTGSVRFFEGTTTLATAPVSGAGTAQTTVTLPVGSHTLGAEYQPTGLFSTSTGITILTVDRGSTSLVVGAPTTPLVPGESFNVTVDASAVPPASGTPSGNLTISVTGDSDGGALDGSGHFGGSLTAPEPGIHTVTANYAGDANFLPASGSAQIEVLAGVSIADANAQSSPAENTTVNVQVTLAQASNQIVRVDYATADGTAVASFDYVSASGTVEFQPGETSRTITLTIIGDAGFEQPETFRVILSNPQGALISDSEAIVVINDFMAVPAVGTVALIALAVLLAVGGMFAIKPT